MYIHAGDRLLAAPSLEVETFLNADLEQVEQVLPSRSRERLG